MSKTRDWCPGKRVDILMMCKTWLTVLNEDMENAEGETVNKYAAWGIPMAELVGLGELYAVAEVALQAAQQVETRTEVTNKACRDAFTALVAKMRFVKDRFFKVPPLSGADIVSLQLKTKDTTPTTVNTPWGQAIVEVSYPGAHLIRVLITLLSGTDIDPRADWGYTIYWGIMPPGGATIEEALSVKRYLMKTPTVGDELPHNKFTRRRRETFDFSGDSAKTVYFSIRIENSKGDKGPFGPIVSAVIP